MKIDEVLVDILLFSS